MDILTKCRFINIDFLRNLSSKTTNFQYIVLDQLKNFEQAKLLCHQINGVLDAPSTKSEISKWTKVYKEILDVSVFFSHFYFLLSYYIAVILYLHCNLVVEKIESCWWGVVGWGDHTNNLA